MAEDQLANLAGRSERALRVGSWIIPGGFGLGFAVNTAATPVGASRRLFWYGYASTLFWIDTRHDLIGIYLVQHQPFDMNLGNRFRDLAYEAAAGPEHRPVDRVGFRHD